MFYFKRNRYYFVNNRLLNACSFGNIPSAAWSDNVGKWCYTSDVTDDSPETWQAKRH